MTILDITLELKYKSAIIIINYNDINGEQFFGGTELTKKPPLCRQMEFVFSLGLQWKFFSRHAALIDQLF